MKRDQPSAKLLGGIVPQLDRRTELSGGSRTMSHVRFAISPARKPALTDSKTITRFRAGCRILGKNEEIFDVSRDNFCLLAGHIAQSS